MLNRITTGSFFLIVLIGCAKVTVHEPPSPFASNTSSVLAPGVISTADFHESLNHLSEDHMTVYFTRSSRRFEASTLYVSTFLDSVWTEPRMLSFSGTHYDAGLAFAPTQEVAFFTSKRDPARAELSREWNIWQVAFAHDQWGQPEVLPPPINSDSLDCCLTMNAAGTAFWASNRQGSWDMYTATYTDGVFANIERLSGTVNSAAGEWPGYINTAGNVLLFSSIRETGHGGDDLYVARKVLGTWETPVLLDSTINSASYEDSPRLSYGNRYLLFSSWKDTDFSQRTSNIYVMPVNEALAELLQLES